MTNTKLDIHKPCNRFPPSLSYFVFFQNQNVVVLVFFYFGTFTEEVKSQL